MLTALRRYRDVFREQKRPWRFLAGWLLMKSGTSKFLKLKQKDFSLRFYDSSMSLAVFLAPDDPGSAEQFFRAYLRPGDVVIDVGANIGYLTLVASKTVGDGGAVLAIEAHPRIAAFLDGNVTLNKVRNVSVLGVAVGEAPGTVRFSNSTQDDQNAVTAGRNGVDVRLVRLDDVTGRLGGVALLKIDVEGYEKFVLDGAPAVLARTQCVFFESWDRHFAKFGYACRDVTDRLRRAGFTVFRAEGSDWAEAPVDYESRVLENLVAVRDVPAFTGRTGSKVHRRF